jgi:hypothetical protein
MMKDAQTGYIEHQFLEIMAYSNDCMICNYKKEEHQKLEEKKDKKDEDQQLFSEDTEIQKINPGLPNKPNKVVHENREFPKEILEAYEDPDLCYICWSNKVDVSTLENSECKHLFCMSCVVNHLTSNINNGQVL